MNSTFKKSPKIIKLLLLVIFLIAFAIVSYFSLKSVINKLQKEAVPNSIDINQILTESKTALPTDLSASSEITLARPVAPEELNLAVPFFAQAPLSNWDLPWQEACEEASVLLVANIYFNHKWTRDQFKDQILTLVEWEKKQFGDYKHTSVKQTADILNNYLNLKTIIHENPSFEDLKNILSKGHLIVMTFAGKELGNPNFRNGGPNYHAMVIKGYKADQKIITNDVGTRKGADYVYSWKTIQNSLHDYSEPINTGAKLFIEVLPPDQN